MRREAFDGEWSGDADFLVVVVGLVVEVFELGLGGDGSVDLLLSRDALLPPIGVQFLCAITGHFASASRGISHSSQFCFSAAFKLLAQRFQAAVAIVPR